MAGVAEQLGPDTPLSAAQKLSSDLTDVIRAAPEMKGAPGLALAVAQHGGDVVNNAQAVMAVAKQKSLEEGVKRLKNGVGVDSDTHQAEGVFGDTNVPTPNAYQQKSNQQAKNLQPGPDIAGSLGRLAQGAVGAAQHAATGVNTQPGGAVSQNQPGPTLGAPAMMQAQQGMSATEGALASQTLGALNPSQLMQAPSHTYRYLYDVKERHGVAAMIEAAVPLVGGSLAGYLATHSVQGGDEAAAAEEELMSAEERPTPQTEAENATANATGTKPPPKSAAAGNRAMNATARVLTPPARVAGAAVRTATTGLSSPTLLGGEAAVSVSGHIVYPDSWQRTMNASTWKLPNGTLGPTLGRLTASSLGLSQGSVLYNGISGALDTTMSLAVPDVLAAGGRTYAIAHGDEGLEGFLGKWFPGNAPRTPEAMQALYQQSGKFRSQIATIAKMDTSGQIIAAFPDYEKIAPRLAEAKTSEEVLQVFQDAARTEELLTTSAAPGLGAYGKARKALGGTAVGRIAAPAPMAFDADTERFTGHEFSVGGGSAGKMIYQLLKAGGENERTAQDAATIVSTTHSPAIATNAITNAVKVYVTRKMMTYLPKDAQDLVGQTVKDKINSAVDELMGGAARSKAGQFAVNTAGTDLSYTTLIGPDHQDFASALLGNQAQKIAVPSPAQIKQLALDLANSVKPTVLNRLHAAGIGTEEWIDHNINEKLFQPLALATGGWATRVSASEMAMNILRQGPLNFTAAGIASRAAKLGFKINNVEMPHVVAVMRGILAGVEASAVKSLGKDRILDAAITSVMTHDGHIVPLAVSSAHTPMFAGTDMNSIGELDVRAERRRVGLRPKYTVKPRPLSDQFTKIAPHNTGYFRAWSEMAGRWAHDDLIGTFTAQTYHDELAKHAVSGGVVEGSAADRIATRDTIAKVEQRLNSIPEADLMHMDRHWMTSREGIAKGRTPHQDWANQLVAGLKGTLFGAGTQGSGGVLHEDLLNDIVNKTVPTTEQMAQRYGEMEKTDLPDTVLGRELHFGVSDIVPQLTNKLHSKLLGPIVNTLSREPTYIVDFANERKLLESKVASGEMTQMDADITAEMRAVHKTIRFVHNPADRLKIENMLHVFAPFYFAQNQMIRRIGRLAADNPGAFEQYIKGMLALNHQTQQITARNGFPTALIPGTTLVGKGMTQLMHWALPQELNPVGSIAIGLTGTVDPSSTFNPFAGLAPGGEQNTPGESLLDTLKPSFGPVAALPLKGLQDFSSGRVPKLNSVVQNIEGPILASEPVWMQGVPNSLIQHLAETATGYATGGDKGLTSSYNTVLLSVMQALAQQGDYAKASQMEGTGYPNQSAFKAQFIKQANNITAILFVGQMLTSFFSPTSVQLSEANLQYSDLAQSYINKAKGNVNVGLYNMTMQHPDLVPYEAYKTTTPNGYAFPEVQKTQAFIQANRGMVNKYPAASVFLLPQQDRTGKFSESAYQMEIAMGLRAKDAPGAFFDQLYITSGNAWYFDVLDPQIKAAIKKDPGASYTIYQQVDKIITNYGKTVNPIWADYFGGNSSINKRQQVIQQVGTMLKDPSTPRTPQAYHLGELYELYTQEDANYTSGSMSATKVKAQWGSTMNSFTQKYPDMKYAVQTLFLGAF